MWYKPEVKQVSVNELVENIRIKAASGIQSNNPSDISQVEPAYPCIVQKCTYFLSCDALPVF